MRISRHYINNKNEKASELPLCVGQTLELDQKNSHYLKNVLRVKLNYKLVVFDGSGSEFLATVTDIQKKVIVVTLEEETTPNNESPLVIHLGLAISKGERMDWALQKATELGVTEISPLITERVDVKLDKDRQQKKLDHWQQVVISACEQSGRVKVPVVNEQQELSKWLESEQSEEKYVFALDGENNFNHNEMSKNKPSSVSLLIGPEGGLTEDEIQYSKQKGFKPVCLGPRVLRTETAPVAVISILQYVWGDF